MHVAIDPGATGSIAWLEGQHLIEVRDLPVAKVNGRSVLMPAALAEMLREPGRMPDRAIVERMASRPSDGKVAAFALGRNFGMLQGVLAAMGIPVELVTPAKWKGAMKLSQDKGASRSMAMELWPGAAREFMRVKDDGRAEAALLGRWGAA